MELNLKKQRMKDDDRVFYGWYDLCIYYLMAWDGLSRVGDACILPLLCVKTPHLWFESIFFELDRVVRFFRKTDRWMQ